MRSNRDAAVRALVRQADDFKKTVATWAANGQVVDSLRTPTSASLRAAQDQLSTLARSKGSPAAIVSDLQGRNTAAAYPPQPELLGRSFAFRDWFKGASRTGKPYVSEAYRTAAPGHPLVVGVAAPVLDGSRRVGYLTVLWQLESVRQISQGARADDGVIINVTDQRGQALTGTPRVDDRGQALRGPVSAATREALAGHSVDTIGDGLLQSAGPVPGLGWTVTATLPSSVALAPARTFQRGLGITLGVALLLVLAYTVPAWRVARHRAAARYARSLLEAGLDPLVTISPKGTITDVNEATTNLTGVLRDKVIGTDFSQYFTEPDRANEGYRRAFAQGSITDYPLTMRHRDGTRTEVMYNATVFRDARGKVLGVFAAARDVTDQRRAFEVAQRMAAIVADSGDAIVGMALDGTITNWNPAAERMYGYSSEEILGTPLRRLIPEDRRDDITGILAKIVAGTHIDRFEATQLRKDGTTFCASIAVSPIRDADGRISGAAAILRDVTEQKQAARNARNLVAAEDLVRTVMASASIGIALTDLDGRFRVINQSMRDLLGYDEAWFLAHRLRDLQHPEHAAEARRDGARFRAASSETIVGQVRLVRADDAIVWVRQVVVEIPEGEGQPNLLMVQVEDITAERAAHEALAFQAFHDPLTGLHNRAWTLETLDADLGAATRTGTQVGALFIDLDNFKVVNDSLGHAAGDEVLTSVAGRIEKALAPGDRVGRFGGDEFVVVVEDVVDVQDVERCVERVSASLAADLQVRDHRIVPTASIGIAMSTPTSTPDSLLRDADSAMFQAKAAGRARWQFFDDAMHRQAVARLTIEDELRDAITRDEFVVYYQPIVALDDANVIAHEALMRWRHPTRGLLNPADFLDVAEDTGLITAIGAQVLDLACTMLADHPDLPGAISVNVSAVQLATPDWLSGVRDITNRHQVDPARIVVEVTETAVLSLPDHARLALASLHKLGVGIHVDDFGTGYSSISVLRDLPVTGVKLDLRFVHDLTTGDSPANALAHGLNGLVKGMNLTGIAEGIETEMQAQILRDQGWECGQGYLFGRPTAVPATN